MDTIQTRHARRFLAGLLVAGALAPSGGRAVAPAPNVISGIDVSERGGAVELDIRGSRAPSYTVFKLQDPPRLVVDVAGGDVSALPSPLGVSRGGVLGVSTAQYKDEKSAVGRVIVALDREARYEVTPRGQSLVVRVQKGEVVATASTPSSSAPAPTSSPTATASTATPTPTPTATPTPTPTATTTATTTATATATTTATTTTTATATTTSTTTATATPDRDPRPPTPTPTPPPRSGSS
jgi:type IV pilus assembly protein PilQ